MNQSRKDILAQLENEDKKLIKEHTKSLLTFLQILLRIQRKRPSDDNLEIIKNTHRILSKIEIYPSEEREVNIDEIM